MSQEVLSELIKLYFLKNEELKEAKSNLKNYKPSDLNDIFDNFYKNLNSPSPIVLTWEEAKKLRIYAEEKERFIDKVDEINSSIEKINQNIIDNLPLHNVFITVKVDCQKYFVGYYPQSYPFENTKTELVITTNLAH